MCEVNLIGAEAK